MRSNISFRYYDYYQPEAYVPAADLYIEKEATINDELDKLRLSATRSLFERRDALIVASVSCIYGLGSPEAYYGMMLFLEKGQKIKREEITRRLVDILYERTDADFRRGTFRVRGDVIEVFPTYDDMAYRIELWGDEVASLSQIDPLFGTSSRNTCGCRFIPKTHYVMKEETRASAVESDQERTRLVGSRTGEAGRSSSRSAFISGHVRSGNDQGHGLLPWHRKLFAALYRAVAGRTSAHAAGLFSPRLSDVH